MSRTAGVTIRNMTDILCILEAYKTAKRRLLLFDYDGTLVSFAVLPELAKPGPRVLKLVRTLAEDPRNTVVIISGRPREPLGEWFSKLPVTLFAEHGAHIMRPGESWQPLLEYDEAWKAAARPLMQEAIAKAPGSLIEEKTIALVWHYRTANDHAAGERTAAWLQSKLEKLLKRYDLRIVASSMMVEIRLANVHKGTATTHWLDDPYDFILAAGDDLTDEDLFKALPDTAHTIKIGPGESAARERLNNPTELLELLDRLTTS